MPRARNEILLPFDLGDDPTEVLVQAREAVTGKLARFHLLHVVPDDEFHLLREVYHPESSGGANLDQAMRVAHDWLRAMADAHLAGRRCEVAVRTGHPAEEILRYSVEQSIDLVVLSKTRGASRLRDWILGSTSYEIVRAASCDVTLVRGGASREETMRVREDLDGVTNRDLPA